MVSRQVNVCKDYNLYLKISHEERREPLVEITKESGEGPPQVSVKEIISPSNLIVDGTSENYMFLYLNLMYVA